MRFSTKKPATKNLVKIYIGKEDSNKFLMNDKNRLKPYIII